MAEMVMLEPDEHGNVHIDWDLIGPLPRCQWWLPVPPDQEAIMDALFPQRRILRGTAATPPAPALSPAPAAAPGPWLDSEKAAAYLDLKPGQFRKIATLIPRNEFTKRYHIDVLNDPSRWRAKPDPKRKRKRKRIEKT